MFTFYLLGFIFWPPWRDQCSRPTNYTFIDPEHEDEIITSDGGPSLVSFIFLILLIEFDLLYQRDTTLLNCVEFCTLTLVN